jgi:outer membrane protein assembly factor BamB
MGSKKVGMVSKVLFMAAAVSLVGSASAQDWPQWRGPARDGLAGKGVAARASWPAALNRAWKVEVGEGHASPVVVGNRVYVFARRGDDEVLESLDLATGRSLWKQGHPAPYTMNSAASAHGKGPKSTPLVAGGRVFTLGIAGALTAHDAATGRVLWRHDFQKRFKATSPTFGTAMSPAVDGDRVIAHVGGESDGSLSAFDAATGAERWSWKADGPGYASPIVATLAGRRQVVTQTQQNVVGLAADTGELLWKIPFTTAYTQNAVTPVISGDLVVYSGLDKGVSAVRIQKRGATYAAEPTWSNDEVSNYMSTPILDGGVLYGLSHKKKGQLYALDLATGKTLWLSEGRLGENAALVSAGGALLALTTDSALIVAKPDAKAYSVIRTYTVADSPTWAHPAPTSGGILVKDRDSLALWRIP